MKKLLFVLLSLATTFTCLSQDSALVKLTVEWEAADVEYMYKHIAYRDVTEDLYDRAKAKMSIQPYPTGTQLVSLDTIPRYQLVAAFELARSDARAQDKSVFNHIRAKLVALNDPYINYRIFKSDERVNNNFSDDRKMGRDRYRKTVVPSF